MERFARSCKDEDVFANKDISKVSFHFASHSVTTVEVTDVVFSILHYGRMVQNLI